MKRIIVLSIILALFPHFGYAQVLPPLFPSGNYLIPRDSAWIIGSSTVEMLANTSTISYLTVTTCVGCAGGTSYDPTWLLNGTSLYATDTISYVGIGTVAPTSLLELQGGNLVVGGIASTTIKGDGNNSIFESGINLYSDANIYGGSAFAFYDSSDTFLNYFYTDTEGVLRLNNGAIDYFFGTQEGKIGIGDGNPISTLDILGTFNVGTNTADWFTIDENGFVGIGTTTPSFGLELMASSTDGYFGISNNNLSGNIFVVDGDGNIGFSGNIATGTWNGTAIADAYVADDITLTNITQITNRLLSSLDGTLNFASTTGTIDISDRTNLAAGTLITLADDTLNVTNDLAQFSNATSVFVAYPDIAATNTSFEIKLASSTFWGDNTDIVFASSSNWDIAQGLVSASSTNWDLAYGRIPATLVLNDLIIATSTSAFSRLAAGSDGQVLKMSGTELVWGTDNTGGTGDPVWIQDGTDVYSTNTASHIIVGTTTAQNYFTIGTTTDNWLTMSNAGVFTIFGNANFNTIASGTWNGAVIDTAYIASSSAWDLTEGIVTASSSNWDITQGIVTASSSNWDLTYGTVNASSSNWDLGFTNARTKSISFSMSSTTMAELAQMPVLVPNKPVTLFEIGCKVIGGTSREFQLTDGTNVTEKITCTTTYATSTVAVNGTFTGYEDMFALTGTSTGDVNWLHGTARYTLD